MKTKFEILFIKTTKSLDSRANKKIPNFINENLCKSHNVVVRDWIA